jgi:hypothetical protein
MRYPPPQGCKLEDCRNDPQVPTSPRYNLLDIILLYKELVNALLSRHVGLFCLDSSSQLFQL